MAKFDDFRKINLKKRPSGTSSFSTSARLRFRLRVIKIVRAGKSGPATRTGSTAYFVQKTCDLAIRFRLMFRGVATLIMTAQWRSTTQPLCLDETSRESCRLALSDE